MAFSFVDIHCHLLPDVDDGAADMREALAMARMSVAEGTTTIIATPHQLGAYAHVKVDDIRRRAADLQKQLSTANIPLRVLPGADVRVEPGVAQAIARGEVLTLGDHKKHVLLELPHEIYVPLEPVLQELWARKLVGVLSHPERNQGVLREPGLLMPLVDAGCLLQVTAGSVCGMFGPQCQQLCEWLLGEGLVHFVATSAHNSRTRPPMMGGAYQRIISLTDEATALDLCSRNPAKVAVGEAVRLGRRELPKRRGFLYTKKAAA